MDPRLGTKPPCGSLEYEMALPGPAFSSLPPPQHTLFTTQRKYRLSSKYRYRAASVFGSKFVTERHAPVFEVQDGEQTAALHPLGYLLAGIFTTAGGVKRFATSFFGLIPENSLLDKCPYYRTASEATTPNLPASLKWVSATSGKERELARSDRDLRDLRDIGHIGLIGRSERRNIDSSLVGYRKRYRRDSLTLPAMVVIYNTTLVWMMFNIEVRASSL